MLVARYTLRAHRAAWLLGAGEDADDVVQEAFVKAFRSLPKFRAGEPFAPWLLSIVANETKNLLRSLNALPDRERQALVCRYFLDLSEAETAQVLQWPLGSVKSRTSRALGRLRGLVVTEDQGRVFHG